MALRITCPTCKASYTIDGNLRGTRILCRDCQKPMQIPAAKVVPPAPKTKESEPGIVEAKSNPAPPQAMPVLPLPQASPVRGGGLPGGPLPKVEPAATNPARQGEPSKQSGGIALLLLIGGGAAVLGLLLIGVVAVAATYFLMPSNSSSSTKARQVALETPKPKTPDHLDDNQQPKEKHEPKADIIPEPKIDPLPDLKPESRPAPKLEPEPAQVPEPKQLPETPKTLPAEVKLAPPPPVGQLSREVLSKVKRATIFFRVTLANGRTAQGSGFFAIESGLVLTNAHVLGMLKIGSQPPKKIEIVYQSGEPDSRTFAGKILGVDNNSDLALLRVAGDKLPEPLEVKSAKGLVETQTVYVVGFPFGESLGKNITVSPSSVTSLRKGPDGELVKVQVNGGMQPGNSGGPVVNTNGEVVGVAVSIIEGTQISFAVPGDQVQLVVNGRITGVSSGVTVRDKDQLQMPVYLDVLDPLGRVQKASFDWWTAPDGKSRVPSDAASVPLPGDSKHQSQELVYKAGRAKGDITLPTEIPPGHVIWIQPRIVNGTGQSKWAPALPYAPSVPVDKQAANLTLKHYWGARPLTFTTHSNFTLIKPGVEDLKYSVGVNAKMTETMVAQQKTEAMLRLRYLRYEIGVPTKLLLPEGQEKIKRIVQKIGTMHADLVIDDRNNLKSNKVDLTLSPPDARADLADLHGQIQESLETMSVPLPGRVVQPGESWRAHRSLMIFTGDRGDPAPMEVTYTFHGVLKRNGRDEAVINIRGLAQDRLDGEVSVTGMVRGTAYLDLTALQISSADVKAEFDMSDGRGKRMIVSLESKMERTLGKEVLRAQNQLTQKDARDDKQRPFKTHNVKLEAGKPCVVSLESPKGPGQFDTFLRIEDANGNVLAQDDDSGVDLNSLIVFTPPQAGVYRIVATCFEPAVGNYLLVVRQ